MTIDIKSKIKPSDLGIADINHLWNAFGQAEAEISARWIVRFCEEKNGDTWDDFTVADLTAFYQERIGMVESFRFNNLTDRAVRVVDGRVTLTQFFVVRCLSSCVRDEDQP
jgi:outer membrane receptor protein involved in Fe transport